MPAAPPAPTMIAHYLLGQRLGAGGMGVIYRAFDTRLEREVALKFLSDHIRWDEAALGRLRREACAASVLNHPNIRGIYHFDESDGRHFIVMELLEGKTLEEIIAGRPLPVAMLADYGAQVASALQAAHSKGVVHRDIKPANIFVTADGVVKVLDFGIAARQQLGADGDWARTTLHSMTLGTAAYMSPEQARGEPVDRRSDIFSLGVVLYEMATGQLPFAGATLGVIFDGLLNREPAAPSSLNTRVGDRLDRVILRALQKDKRLRHQDAGELLGDLRAAASPAPLRASSPPRRGSARYRRRFLPAAAAAVLCLLAVAATVAGRRLFVPTPVYQPCIVLGDVRIDEDGPASDALLIAFELETSLSQYSDLPVYTGAEFDLAAAANRASSQARRETEPAALPALRVTPIVHRSLGSLLEVDLDIRDRGRTERRDGVWRGTPDLLLGDGIDRLVRVVLDTYEAGAPSAARKRAPLRSVATLLSAKPDALRHYWQAVGAWDRLDAWRAERELEAAREIDPDFALVLLLLGEVRIFQNQWDGARLLVEQAGHSGRELTEANRARMQALLARASGRPFEEQAALQHLIGLKPQRKPYIYELGESYFHVADVERAAAQYRRAIALDPGYALAYNHLGYCYSWKGEHARAIQQFERYLAIDRSANAYDSLGDAYMHAGDYARSTAMKQRAVELDPGLYYARRALALIDIMKGRYRAAESRLLSAVDSARGPVEKARFFAALAFLRQREGRVDDAVAMSVHGRQLMAGADNNAPSEELLWLQGTSELRRGRIAAAREVLGALDRIVRALGITGNNYKPAYKYRLHLAGSVAAAEGRRDDVVRAVDELRWIGDKLGYWGTPFDKGFFLDEAGQLREKIGQPGEALLAYRQALEYNPHYALARLHLARLLRASGQLAESRRELTIVLDEWRDADEAGDLLAARRLLAQRP